MEPDEYYSEDSHLEAYWEDRISGYDYEQEAYYDNDPQADRADYDLWEEEQVYQDNEGYDDLSSDYEDSSDFS
jgi:hypothetical protein